MVELKALHVIGPIEVAQVINYLRIARRSRGLLLNFGATRLQHKRLVVDLVDDLVGQSGKRVTSGGTAELRFAGCGPSSIVGNRREPRTRTSR